MVTVDMQKAVTVIRDKSIITIPYKRLAAELVGEKEITAVYCHGDARRRAAQLAKMGFKLKEVIWRNTESLHGLYREVWERARD